MSRTLLTILGIVIGITAIIIVVSMGQGAQDLILSQIQGLGSRTIIIEPGREPRGPADFSEMYTESLKQRELDALMNSANVQGVEYVAPMVIQVVPVNYENEISRTNVLGSSADIANVLDIYADDGDILQEDDIRNHTSVAVLGSEVKIKLFGESEGLSYPSFVFFQVSWIFSFFFRPVYKAVFAHKPFVSAFLADSDHVGYINCFRFFVPISTIITNHFPFS